MQQWRIRIRGTPRKEVDRALLIQAVIALGKQLQQEAHERSHEVIKVTREEEP